MRLYTWALDIDKTPSENGAIHKTKMFQEQNTSADHQFVYLSPIQNK